MSFSVGKLVDFQWKLGVAVKSNNCKNLGSPFVSILVRVADANNKIQTQTIEMTISQFQVSFGRRSSINVKSNAAAHSSSSHLFSSFFSRQIKAAVTVLKGYTNSPTDGLLNALRFTTIHLNDSETPNTIKQLLN